MSVCFEELLNSWSLVGGDHAQKHETKVDGVQLFPLEQLRIATTDFGDAALVRASTIAVPNALRLNVYGARSSRVARILTNLLEPVQALYHGSFTEDSLYTYFLEEPLLACKESYRREYDAMFEITPEDISLIDDNQLRAVVARLCEAELRQCGYSSVAVTAGGNQDAIDGGIDLPYW